MTAATCQEPGCTGTIVDGYCDVCGTPGAGGGTGAAVSPASPASPASAAVGGAAAGSTGRCQEPGCTGTVVDGYCDVCGTPGAGASGGAPAASTSAAEEPWQSPSPEEHGEEQEEEPITPPARPQPTRASSVPNGTPCRQPGCAGHYLDGYCDVCGSSAEDPAAGETDPDSAATSPMAATRTAASDRLSSTAIGSARARQSGSKATRRIGSASQRMRRSRLGQGLTTIPPIAAIDASDAIMRNPVVPEDKRFCSNCGTKVGRGRDGEPGRTTGFCPKCRQPFSFDPKLKAGDLVAGQYEVAGCLAHGGLGWIYLARDRNVSGRWVVLKGLLNSGDPDALAAALAEQRFLAQVEHPNIVEIYNFVSHEGAGYIVMEYVGGTSLKALLKQRMRKAGRYDPLPVDQALAYVLEILPAFTYLHDLGLAYCDFKPDNMIQVGDDIKLIDLGGVRKIDDEDSAIFGTVGYQAPEVAEQGVSVASDIYTIGRTLVVLTLEFRGYQTTFVDSLPPVEDTPVFQRYDSFYRLLRKACAKSPDDRFASADELRVQMLGVLREVVAQDAKIGRASSSAPSVLFDAPSIATDTLDWYTLPTLRPDTHDAQAGLVADIRTMEPHRRVDELRAASPQTPEVLLELARTGLDRGDPGLVDAATNQLLQDDPWEWRAVWMQGLRALAARDAAGAQSAFNAVYGQVPGELAPKLALAFACEVSGESAVAESLYAVCARTDFNYIPVGAFGMARIRSARRDIGGAVEALDLIPSTSRAYALARFKRSQILAAAGTGLPGLAESLSSIRDVPVDPYDRARLRVTVFENALAWVTSPGGGPGPTEVDGRPGTVRGMREGLEESLRELARVTTDPDERVRLVDRANQVRPWTLR
ncbi:MAG TPA: tetratricopeptide repeat protein [Dermatophilaceae bacterium]|nr:tetratricopeptide repeat protein [Dermatophilaceae bacterium]